MYWTRVPKAILNNLIIIPILYLLILLILRPLLLLFLLPFAILRSLVSLFGPLSDKSLFRLVSPQSVILASDHLHTSPKWNLVVVLMFKLNPTANEDDDNDKEFNRIKKTTASVRQIFKTEFEIKKLNGCLKYPELRQYFTTWLGYLFWKWDPHYNFNNHFSIYNSQDRKHGVNETDLYEIAEELIWKPFPKGRSPWEIICVENYKSSNNEKSKIDPEDEINPGFLKKLEFPVIFRFHHGIADGFAINNLIVRAISNSPGVLQVPKVGPLLQSKGSINTATVQIIKNVLNLSKFLFLSPYDSLKLGLLPRKESNTWCVPGHRLDRRFYFGTSKGIPLSMIKDVKSAVGASFTAVLLGAIAGGIRKVLRKGAKLKNSGKFEMKCAFALPFDSSSALGNHVTACQCGLPIEIEDPLTRIQTVDRELKRIVRASVPLKAYYYTKFIGWLPVEWSRKIGRNVLPTIWFSNFPGPAEAIKLDFGEVSDVFFAGGLGSGNTGIGIGVISNNERVGILMGIDRSFTQDPNLSNEILQHVVEEIINLWTIYNV